jgi:hypothetical protein
MTPYGRRRVSQTDLPTRPSEGVAVREPVVQSLSLRWGRIVGFHAIGIFVLLIILHVTGGGLRHH